MICVTLNRATNVRFKLKGRTDSMKYGSSPGSLFIAALRAAEALPGYAGGGGAMVTPMSAMLRRAKLKWDDTITGVAVRGFRG